MTALRFTTAQRNALDWLPADGSWRIKPGKLAAALNSLSLSHRGLVECEWGDFGPRGGRELRWRLTSHGVAVKSEIRE